MAMLLSAGAWAPKRGNPWLNLDEAAVEAFGKMCEEIVNVIVETDDESGVPAQRAAISTLEVFASRLPSGHPIFSKCLASVVEGISSKNPGKHSSHPLIGSIHHNHNLTLTLTSIYYPNNYAEENN
ncbi:hypothetical protein Bca101_073577 [Brassica carinata]